MNFLLFGTVATPKLMTELSSGVLLMPYESSLMMLAVFPESFTSFLEPVLK